MVRGLSAEKNIFLLFTCCPYAKKYFFLSRRCRLCCCLLQRLTYAFASAALAAVICFVASLLASAALACSQIFYRSFGILEHYFYICINQNGFAVADSIYIHAVIYGGLSAERIYFYFLRAALTQKIFFLVAPLPLLLLPFAAPNLCFYICCLGGGHMLCDFLF